MKVEMLETVLEGRERFEEGDIRLVPDDIGQKFCSLGWAKDVDGVVDTGERIEGAAKLDVQSTKFATKSEAK